MPEESLDMLADLDEPGLLLKALAKVAGQHTSREWLIVSAHVEEALKAIEKAQELEPPAA